MSLLLFYSIMLCLITSHISHVMVIVDFDDLIRV